VRSALGTRPGPGERQTARIRPRQLRLTLLGSVVAIQFVGDRERLRSDCGYRRAHKKREDPDVTEHLPSWPTVAPTHGSVVLREFSPADTHLALELGDDPYIPLIGSLPAHPSPQQALEWIERQHGRLTEGIGLSFVIADSETNTAVGSIGLWLRNLSAGRATAGYSVSPRHRGRGIATSGLKALTAFAWTIPALHRIELYIEPWNQGSFRAAAAAGYQREGLLRSHQEIGDSRRDMLLYAAIRP
jgi:ribosomal-protein-alanine N-acetyltransferase